MQEASRYELVLQITLIRISILICTGTLNFDVLYMYRVIIVISNRSNDFITYIHQTYFSHTHFILLRLFIKYY